MHITSIIQNECKNGEHSPNEFRFMAEVSDSSGDYTEFTDWFKTAHEAEQAALRGEHYRPGTNR